MSDSRSAAEIEAELDATRLALTETVNELHYRIKPSTQINNAKESVRSFFAKVKAGDPKAITIVVGTVIGVSALVAIPIIRRN